MLTLEYKWLFLCLDCRRFFFSVRVCISPKFNLTLVTRENDVLRRQSEISEEVSKMIRSCGLQWSWKHVIICLLGLLFSWVHLWRQRFRGRRPSSCIMTHARLQGTYLPLMPCSMAVDTDSWLMAAFFTHITLILPFCWHPARPKGICFVHVLIPIYHSDSKHYIHEDRLSGWVDG